MAKLRSATRNKLPRSAFAIRSDRAYPIEDTNHAKAALSMVAQHGTPAQQAEVRAAVAKRYPGMGK